MKNKFLSLSLALGFALISGSLVACNSNQNSEVKPDNGGTTPDVDTTDPLEGVTVYDRLLEFQKSENYLVASTGNIGIRLFENRVGITKNVYTYNDQVFVDDEPVADLTSGFVNIDNKTAFFTYNSEEDAYKFDGIYDEEKPYIDHVTSMKDLHLDNDIFKEEASKDYYIFNLRKTAQGKNENDLDAYNAYILGEMIHLGSPANYLDDVEINVTQEGLEISMVIDGLIEGMQPLYGQITTNLIFNGAVINDAIEEQALAEKDTIKTLEFNSDFKEFNEMIHKTYQVNIPTVGGDFVDVYYGSNYFAISAAGNELVHKINKDGKIELYGTNPETKKLEFLEAETTEIQKIQSESSLSGDELLEIMSKEITSIGYLKNLKEFGRGGVFSTTYGEIFENETGVVNGIVVEDMFQLTGICDAIDSETEWECFAPYRLMGTGFGWDKKGTDKDYSDDEVSMFIVTFEGAAISKLAAGVTFNSFGVEYPGVEDLTPTLGK